MRITFTLSGLTVAHISYQLCHLPEPRREALADWKERVALEKRYYPNV
jgi:hypothetical protein